MHGSDPTFIYPLLQCLLANRLQFPKYDQLITKLLNGERLPSEYGVIEQYASIRRCLY
jgi:FKBP12-rapamycin complex-associated protein